MKKILAVTAAASLILLTTTTNPAKAPAFLLMMPFVAIFIVLLVAALYVFERRGWPKGRRIRGAILAAGIPVVLLVMQSIGQLTVRDLLTLGAIFGVLYFYLSRLSFAK